MLNRFYSKFCWEDTNRNFPPLEEITCNLLTLWTIHEVSSGTLPLRCAPFMLGGGEGSFLGLRTLLELAVCELSGGGGGGGEGFGHGDLDTVLVEEYGSSNTEASSGESELNEGVPHEGSQDRGGNHQDLVHEVALNHEQRADDTAGSHPEGVRHSRLLLINVPVQGVDGGEHGADVDGNAILDRVVEGVVEPGLQHVVYGGGGGLRNGGRGVLAGDHGVVGGHGVVYGVHLVAKIKRENGVFSSRKVDRRASPTNAQVRKPH